MKREENRIGLCFITKYGESFVVMEYINNANIKIKFKNNYEKYVSWCNIIKNAVISPYAKTVYGVGYIGEGEFNHKNNKKEYEYWKYMIRRCYDPYFINNCHLTYKDCFIESSLLNFQNFVEWFKDNYFEIEEDRMELDKDILEKGNKVYDREHMMFVPKRINDLFVKCDASRGKYPIGVCWHKATNKFIVACNVLENNKSKRKHLGVYNTKEEAFTCYKNFKENYIKQVADEYYSKGLIPKKLYDAMYKYEVEIND